MNQVSKLPLLTMNSSQESILAHVLSLRSKRSGIGEGAMYNIGLDVRLPFVLSREQCHALVSSCCHEHTSLAVACDSSHITLTPSRQVVTFETHDDDDAGSLDRLKDAPFTLLPDEPLARFHFCSPSASGQWQRLIVVCHHLVVDGYSLQRMVYPSIARFFARDVSPARVVQRSMVVATDAPGIGVLREFWLRSIPAEIVPIDFPRLHDIVESTLSPTAPITFSAMRRDIPYAEWNSWREPQRASKVSNFTWMFASLWSMWSHYAGRFDFGIGVAFLGRLQPHLRSTVSFAKVLPLYPHLMDGDSDTDRDLGALTWQLWLQRIQRGIRAAKQHEALSPQDLMGERSVSTQVSLVVTEDPAINGSLFSSGGSSDLTIYLRLGPSSLPVRVEYVWRDQAWSHAAADQFHANWMTLLASAHNEPISSTRTWRQLNWLHDAQRQRVLVEHNSAQRSEVVVDLSDATRYTLHGMFQATAKRMPDALAVYESDTRKATYAELDRTSSAMAEQILTASVLPGDRVVVMMPRSLLTMQVILAVLKRGAAYVPIDTSLPVQRIQYIVSQTRATMVMCSAASHDLNEQVRKMVPTSLVCELPDTPWLGEPSSAFHSLGDPLASAYIIYTSGTTGQPKGVEVFHRSSSNTIHHFDRLYRYTSQDRVLQSANLSFDISVAQIFNTWRCGAGLVLLMSGGEWARTIHEHSITGMEAPASVFTSALDVDDLPTSLRHVQLAGEPSPLALIQKITARYPHIVFTNGYGPTESSIYCNMAIFRAQDRFVPIGPPVRNQRTYILNDLNQLVPEGVTGRIFMAGLGPARGYFEREELTREKFLCDAFADHFPAWPGVEPVMYDSGDLARWTHGGVVECLGRRDTQVKWHGYRIELGEIESLLLSCPDVAVKASAAKLCELPSPGLGTETHILVGYVVKEGDACDDATARLLAWLKRHLPHYMIPTMLMNIASLPVSPNGKLDRTQLPVPTASKAAAVVRVNTTAPTLTQVEEQVWQAWVDALGHTPGVANRSELLALDYFEQGGTSLNAMKLLMLLRRNLNRSDLSIADLYQSPQFGPFIARIAIHKCDASMPTERVACVPVTPNLASAAIVGMSGVFPGANDIHQFWDMLLAGQVATHGSSSADKSWREACGRLNVDIAQFDTDAFRLKPSEATLIDPQHRVLLQQTFHALEDAMLDTRDLVTGVYVSTSDSAYWSQVLEPEFRRQGETDEMRMYSARINNRPDQLASRIAYHFNCTGPTIAVQSACSSSLAGLEVALDHLRLGKCDVAIVAAVSLRMPHAYGYRFQPGMIFSEQGQCRPFEQRSDGTVPGCAAVALVLVSEALATRVGLARYAVIDAVAVGNNGRVGDHVSFSTPNVGGQARVLEHALQDAGLGQKEQRRHVRYIESHGTGTAVGDAVEWSALEQVFGGVAGASISIGAVKANVGHTDAAAGLVGVVKAALILSHNVIPPQPDFVSLNAALVPSSVISVARSTMLPLTSDPTYACVQSIGVGGTNASAVLRRCNPAVSPVASFPALLWRGRNVEHARAFEQLITSNKNVSSQRWRQWSHTSLRRALMQSSAGVLTGEVRCVLSHSDFSHGIPADVEVTPSTESRRVVILFAGQGTFSWGQLRVMYQAFDSVRRALVDGLRVLDEEVMRRHGPVPPRFVDMLDTEATPEDLEMWSPILLCLMQMGLWYLWAPHVPAAHVLGHSLGEFASACVTGHITMCEAIQVLYHRIHLLVEFGLHGNGAMAIVRASEQDAVGMIDGGHGELHIACCNSPTQTVISGSRDLVNRFASEHQLKLVRGISVAYHANETYFGETFRRAWFERWPLSDLPAASVDEKFTHVSGIQAAIIRSGTGVLRSASYWWQHLTRPVRYVESVKVVIGQEPAILPVIVEVGVANHMIRLWSDAVTRSVAMDIQSPYDVIQTTEAMQLAFARAWMYGVDIDKNHLLLVKSTTGETVHHSDLPQTPWINRRVWLDGQEEVMMTQPANMITPSTLPPRCTAESLCTAVRAAARSTLDLPTGADWMNVDVFQYGNQSLQIVTMVHRLNKLLGSQSDEMLRPEHVYERPTVRLLETWLVQRMLAAPMHALGVRTSLLFSHGISSQRDWIVFIPPGGGTLHLYMPMIRQLELSLRSAPASESARRRVDCIGFQRPDGTEHVTSVERLARYYLSCLREVGASSSDSIYLVGGSYGGMVAFSMAHYMQDGALAQNLRGLFMIDTPTRATHRFPRTDLCAMVFFAMQHSHQLPVEALSDLRTLEQVRAYLSSGKQACIKSDAEWDECLRFGNIFFEDLSSLLAFDPAMASTSKLSCRTLFAECRDPRSFDAQNTFDDWLPHLSRSDMTRRVELVPGHHISMYSDRGAVEMGRALESMLACHAML